MAIELKCATRFGEPVAHLDTGAVELTEAVHRSQETIPAHYHTAPQLCLVLEGLYEESYRTGFLLGEPGNVLYHAPGAVHANRFSRQGGRCLNVTVRAAVLEAFRQEGIDLHRSGSRRVVPSWRAFRLRDEFRQRDDLTGLVLEELALDLLADVRELPGVCVVRRPTPWLERVRQRVHEEFRSPPSLAELAGEAGVHRVHVARSFRRHFGCTVGDYVRQRRLEVACRELAEGRPSIAQIAYRAGFADQSHLTRALRERVGTTPGRYRSLARAAT